jgi:hypothetical protein
MSSPRIQATVGWLPSTRENLAEVLEEITSLLDLKGKNPFKVYTQKGYCKP